MLGPSILNDPSPYSADIVGLNLKTNNPFQQILVNLVLRCLNSIASVVYVGGYELEAGESQIQIPLPKSKH